MVKQDLFGDHQPMHIDSNNDKTTINAETGVNLLMNEIELGNRAHASSVKPTAIDQISQSSADTADSTGNV